MFTTQHYNVLASVFNAQLREEWCNTGQPDAIQVYTILKTAERLAEVLRGDNHLFDPAYFMNAVCLHTGYTHKEMEHYRRGYEGGISRLNKRFDDSLKEALEDMLSDTEMEDLVRDTEP